MNHAHHTTQDGLETLQDADKILQTPIERSEHPIPAFNRIWTDPEIYLQDITDNARDIYAGISTAIDKEQVRPESRRLWHIAAAISDEYSSLEPAENVDGRRVAYLLALDVLIAEPEAVQRALRALRDELVKFDPALALFAHGEVQDVR